MHTGCEVIMITYKFDGNILSDPQISVLQYGTSLVTYDVVLYPTGPNMLRVLHEVSKEKAYGLIEDVFKQASNLRNFQHVMIDLDELVRKYTE